MGIRVVSDPDKGARLIVSTVDHYLSLSLIVSTALCMPLGHLSTCLLLHIPQLQHVLSIPLPPAGPR